MNSLYVFIFCFLSSVNLWALSVDANLFYFSDSLESTSENTSTDTFYDVAVTINLDKRGRFFTGWSYGSLTSDRGDSGVPSITITDMGPIFGWHINRDNNWVLVAVYNLISTADFTEASSATNEEWRGSSYKVSFGYKGYVVEEMFQAGLYLNYYGSSFSESVSSGTTLSNVSYSKSAIYPSILLSYRFE